ncbi:MAG: hypothetical protein HRT61_01085 [Ekhidna sp.]|nr:hypothetical protein [Ekhidna sp.]
MTKYIDTLIEDIKSVFTSNHPQVKDQKALDECVSNIRESIEEAISDSGQRREFVLRASNIGSPDRKLWMQARDPDYGLHPPERHMTFLMGHILEHLILFLVNETGHEITDQQIEIEKFGIKGHQDCRIDGVPIDVKSASTYGYGKFVRNDVINDDPWGYLYQIAFYSEKDDPTMGWLAVDKQHGKYCLALISSLDLPNVEDRINHLHEMLAKDEAPEEPCHPTKTNPNGNVEIANMCGLCEYRDKCWPTARAFKYSNGIRRFIHIEKEPRVDEITKT